MGPPLSGGSLGCSAPLCKSEHFLSQRIGSAAQCGDEFTLFIDQELVEVPTHVVVTRAVQ